MEESKKYIELPEILPVLPARNTVLFPNAAIPLMVGRSRSLAAIEASKKDQNLILVVAQKEGATDNPGPDDLYDIGTVCLVTKRTKLDKGGIQFLANGIFRFRVSEFVEMGQFMGARGQQLAQISASVSPKAEALVSEIREMGKSILKLATIPGSETILKLFDQIEDPGQIADLCTTFIQIPVAEKQKLLELQDVELRLEALVDHMVAEKKRLSLQNEIHGKMMERLSKDQRRQMLKEQMRTIQKELGDDGDDVHDELAEKIETVGLNEEALKVAKDELSRLSMVQRASPEYHVIRTYLEWLVSLPWKRPDEMKDVDLQKAREILDEQHYGIDKVKKRIVQFLAVTKLKKDLKGPILCLLGPPGVGKTSLGKSIAEALGRKFVRASLGGVRDEAELRGHRRTYVGALPGRLIQSMKRVGVPDPVILLDEIDKVGTDFRGDPASALLEILDPEQNSTFVDHYLDVPFDLSQVFFVTTANRIDTIPPALRDRLEIIDLSSYSKVEKVEIVKRHLIPKVLKDHGIKPGQLEIPDSTIGVIIRSYTREAGVRNLQRHLAHLCRAAAEEIAEGKEKVVIKTKNLEKILGPKRFHEEKAEDRVLPGVATGLAWTPVGGEILKIEVTRMPGKGHLQMTGQLGEIMRESAQIGLSLLRNYSAEDLAFDKTDFHIHVPAGAIPKDGPSAGSAMFLALSSLVEGKPLNTELAVTGEITLRGAVLPVGGIKEKVLAAHRAGIKKIVLPELNKGDLVDVPKDVKSQIEFKFVNHITQLLKQGDLRSTARVVRESDSVWSSLPN